VNSPALVVSGIQLVLLLPAVLVLLAVSKVAAYSALLGGLLFVLPNAYFTAYAFRYSGKDSVQLVVRAFYRGQLGKLVLAMVGFAVVLQLVRPLDVMALMSAYGFMIASQWFLAREVSRRMTD